ncbi:8-oxoguanine deaminase [Kineococcus rhizosphaerae]|uniref:Cytosine/adenosine deaminase-related metal-dependent hydrolase n=1 Tax=Kineococcus rhizosphaerae TaxID=559628 RepID=A0A2T0R720_9ACTN|nr:8-oxoguanine deaminase [Kineococcus rhizosphaerae]PRY16965.1 cytosine/adenosine deaminase-related metal-dependent hydrolase [Kineococcus rhizosphaerae]
MPTLLITGAAVATVAPSGTEHRRGFVVVDDGVVTAVGEGEPPAGTTADRVVDGTGHLLTPGFVNTHHHLYQWATRGFAVDAGLFEWLTTLYPVWARLDAVDVEAAARAGLARLALTGCTTTSDHHYLHPHDGGDQLAATIAAARTVGLRFSPTRGSMDLGTSAGGLPPDSVVETIDTVLAATDDAVRRHHDTSPGSMVRIGAAPCSPFSVTPDLLRQTAAQAAELRIRRHTHLAETADEEEFCARTFGRRPVEVLEDLGWLGPDVWLAHCVHLSDSDIAALARTGSSVAHCPSSNARLGAGMARAHDLLAAGVSVGLGVDGAASSEQGSLADELRQMVYTARLRGGPDTMSARDALRAATIGGAGALGRAAEIGSIEVGKRADLALWDLRGLGHADLDDPVVALVIGPTPPLRLSTVEGRVVVEDGELRTTSEQQAVADLVAARRRVLSRP